MNRVAVLLLLVVVAVAIGDVAANSEAIKMKTLIISRLSTSKQAAEGQSLGQPLASEGSSEPSASSSGSASAAVSTSQSGAESDTGPWGAIEAYWDSLSSAKQETIEAAFGTGVVLGVVSGYRAYNSYSARRARIESSFNDQVNTINTAYDKIDTALKGRKALYEDANAKGKTVDFMSQDAAFTKTINANTNVIDGAFTKLTTVKSSAYKLQSDVETTYQALSKARRGADVSDPHGELPLETAKVTEPITKFYAKTVKNGQYRSAEAQMFPGEQNGLGDLDMPLSSLAKTKIGRKMGVKSEGTKLGELENNPQSIGEPGKFEDIPLTINGKKYILNKSAKTQLAELQQKRDTTWKELSVGDFATNQGEQIERNEAHWEIAKGKLGDGSANTQLYYDEWQTNANQSPEGRDMDSEIKGMGGDDWDAQVAQMQNNDAQKENYEFEPTSSSSSIFGGPSKATLDNDITTGVQQTASNNVNYLNPSGGQNSGQQQSVDARPNSDEDIEDGPKDVIF